MATTAMVAFWFSLTGLGALFALKAWEEKSGRVFALASRKRADKQALVVRTWGLKVAYAIEHLPSISVLFVRWLIHLFAVGVARFARAAERGAQYVADFVSHQRHFERRESNSEFLKEVTNHKNGIRNGNGNGEEGVDTSDK